MCLCSLQFSVLCLKPKSNFPLETDLWPAAQVIFQKKRELLADYWLLLSKWSLPFRIPRTYASALKLTSLLYMLQCILPSPFPSFASAPPSQKRQITFCSHQHNTLLLPQYQIQHLLNTLKTLLRFFVILLNHCILLKGWIQLPSFC